MELVSSNSDHDLEVRRARERAELAMLDLTANLLRIVRGAGKPYEIGRQVIACATAMQDHWDVAKVWPYNEMAEAIRLPGLYDMKYGEGRDGDMAYARQSILRGALQHIASDLLEQRTQQRAGDHEMMQGVNEILRIREERHREFVSQSREARLAAAKKTIAKVRARSKAKAKAAKSPRRAKEV